MRSFCSQNNIYLKGIYISQQCVVMQVMVVIITNKREYIEQGRKKLNLCNYSIQSQMHRIVQSYATTHKQKKT